MLFVRNCTIFLPPIDLRETKSISNIARNLSRILESLAKLSNILGFIKSFQRHIRVSNEFPTTLQRKKRKRNNTRKLDLCFILDAILNNTQI